MGFQYYINSLADRVRRGVASIKEKAMLEYYEYTRGDKAGSRKGDWFATNFFNLPFSYSRMNDWVHYRQAEYEADLAVRQRAEQARRDTFLSGYSVYQSAKRKGYHGSFEQWQKDYLKDAAKLDLEHTKYNPTPGSGFFKTKHSPDSHYFGGPNGPRTFVSFDIETNDRYEPISVSAIKFAYNKETRNLEIVDTLQRYYESQNKWLTGTYDVHKLTEEKLRLLRQQQGAKYSTSYNKKEAGIIENFFGNSILIGQNIVDFDMPQLFRFGHMPANQTMDTMTAARIMWPGQKNDLDSVFHRLFGMTMAEAGLPHHDANSDTVAAAMVWRAMMGMSGDAPEAMRYVLTHGGTHLAPPQSMSGRILNEKGEWVDLPVTHDYVIKGRAQAYGSSGSYINMEEEKRKMARDVDGSELDIEELMRGGRSDAYDLKNPETGKLKEGFSYADEAVESVVSSTGSEMTGLMQSALLDAVRNLHKEIQASGMISQQVKEAYALGNRTRMSSLIDRLSSLGSEEAMRGELIDLGYGDGDIAVITGKALRHKQRREEAERASSIDAMDTQISRWKREGWLSAKQINTLARSSDPFAMEEAYYDMKFEHDRDKKIEKAVRHGQITQKQGDNLRDNVKSYEELEDTMDQMIQWNKKLNNSMEGVTQRSKALHSVLASLANIHAYNFERWESAFRSEVHGIKGAARGLVPNIVYNPLSRLTEAGMNAFSERTAPWKAAYRLGGIAGGTLLHAGLASGNPWVAAAGAAFKIGTQIVGNVGEAKITRWGEGIQNNFNTLGFLQDMILMPFRLLRAAINKVIKGLGILAGALAGLTKLMTSGLTNMMSMGNPITGLTGMDYGAYAGSMSVDAAALLGKGTINNMFNDFATQRMQLYTTGQLNMNRLVGASMLGVFDDVYGNKMDEESSFNSMLDALIKRTSKESGVQRKWTYTLANMINPNLGALLQTANTLGVDSYEALKRPRGMWRYEEDDLNRRRAGWQRAQWEYQYAGMQKGFTMNRVATALWNGPAGWGISGKGLYNGFNKVFSSVADALETGKWEKVGETIKNLWDTIVKGAEGAWTSIKKIFNIEGDASPWQMLVSSFAKIGVKAIDIFKDTILPAINNVWDNIVKIVIDKMSGLMEFLSTIRVDKDEFINQVILGKKSDKPWIRSIMDTSIDDVFEKRSHYNWGTGHDSLDKFITAVKVYAEQTGDVPPIAALQLGQPWAPTKDELETAVNYFKLSPQRSKIFNKILTEQSDESLAIGSDLSTSEYLDLITQHGEAPGAAAYFHGRYNDTLKKRSSFFRYGNKIYDEYTRQRDVIEDAVLNEARNTAKYYSNPSNVPPLLGITIKDDKNKKEAEATLYADGSINARDYNGSVVVEGRDGLLTLTQAGSTGIVGAGI